MPAKISLLIRSLYRHVLLKTNGCINFEYVCVLFVYRYTGFQRIARKVTRAQIFPSHPIYISGCLTVH